MPISDQDWKYKTQQEQTEEANRLHACTCIPPHTCRYLSGYEYTCIG